MSRPPFKMVPNGFIDACASGEFNERQFFLGCFIFRHASHKTGRLSLALGELAQRSNYKLSSDSLLNDLKGIRPAWLAFESAQGQRAPYDFRLTGLAEAQEGAKLPLSELGAASEAEPPQVEFEKEPQPQEPPQETETSTSERPPNNFRNELPDSSEVEPPHSEVPSEVPSEVNRTAQETLGGNDRPLLSEVPAEVALSTTSIRSEGRKQKAASEGVREDAVGTTTSVEPEPDEFSPERLDELELNPHHDEERQSSLLLFEAEKHDDAETLSPAELNRRHESGEI